MIWAERTLNILEEEMSIANDDGPLPCDEDGMALTER